MRALPPGVRLVINRQKRGRKASTPSQTEPHVEHVAMDSESEGAYVRVVMETLPTLARISLPKRQAAGPKGEGLKAIQSSGVWHPPVRRPGAKHTSQGHAKWTHGTE